MKTIKITAYSLLIGVTVLGAFGFAKQLERQKKAANTPVDYTINKIWELPNALDEVSGIVWLDNTTIASVQDEDGIIFLYDLKQKKIVQQIDFAGDGDYEGITIHNKDAYVLRSDGKIYEVKNFQSSNKEISTFNTSFSARNNVESLALDIKNNKLIIAPKDRDYSDDFKGLYTIPVASKTMDAQPSIKISMSDSAFKNYKKKKVYKTFRPSDVAIHPLTGDYYVLEGKDPKLVILNTNGVIKKVHKLKRTQFSQPEGITFSPDGTLYISNEAGDNAANILEVTFK